jgi:EAL domain-containing protein (putative c-di-GMP-specific phosphodiesterase class I)
MALYKAKAQGRNCIQYFEENLDLMAQQRRMLELDIRTALEEHQFSLAFQPIVAMPSNEIAAYESLIRWEHPERGFVSPAEFIPVAEETGLILEIGRWVLEEAIREASEWTNGAAVAVNFSAVQFQDRNFPLFLVSTLKRFDFPSDRLELEITETALLEDSESTIEMLEQFRALGVRISLDDFGTGYSSLSQLRTFPFNKIKIDGSFVRDLERDPSAVAVIRAVTNIGKILSMTVVAECVENEEQLAFLVTAGCDQIQGYYTGRPQSALATRAAMTVAEVKPGKRVPATA